MFLYECVFQPFNVAFNNINGFVANTEEKLLKTVHKYIQFLW